MALTIVEFDSLIALSDLISQASTFSNRMDTRVQSVRIMVP